MEQDCRDWRAVTGKRDAGKTYGVSYRPHVWYQSQRASQPPCIPSDPQFAASRRIAAGQEPGDESGNENPGRSEPDVFGTAHPARDRPAPGGMAALGSIEGGPWRPAQEAPWGRLPHRLARTFRKSHKGRTDCSVWLGRTDRNKPGRERPPPGWLETWLRGGTNSTRIPPRRPSPSLWPSRPIASSSFASPTGTGPLHREAVGQTTLHHRR